MQPAAVRPLLGEWQEDAPEGFALEVSKGVMAMGLWRMAEPDPRGGAAPILVASCRK